MNNIEDPCCSHLEQKSKRFSEEGITPTLSGNTPGGPLYDYFHDRLPEGLNESRYEDGLSCLGYARLIALALGGVGKARIYWVGNRNLSDEEEYLEHAYVIPTNSRPTDLAFNNVDSNKKLKVKDVLKSGIDITEEVFNDQWERL